MPPRRAMIKTAPRASIATENYLKQLLSLAQRSTAGRARSRVLMSDLARALELTRGTVTTQVKRLAREGLVRYERYAGVELTARGEQLALGVLHRHRLVETFLVRTLGLDWAEVHEEAERLEHVLSERVLEALDRWLGRPAVDPHGDPIPRATGATGAVGPSTEASLADCLPGRRVRVERLLEQSASFLRFASRSGVTPGAVLEVMTPAGARRSVRVRTTRGRAVTIERDQAMRVLVNPLRRGSRRGAR